MNNGQTVASIKVVRRTMKICCETDKDINLALLQIRSTPKRTGLPSPAALLFNRPI